MWSKLLSGEAMVSLVIFEAPLCLSELMQHMKANKKTFPGLCVPIATLATGCLLFLPAFVVQRELASCTGRQIVVFFFCRPL
jgi:hypothetical protein